VAVGGSGGVGSERLLFSFDDYFVSTLPQLFASQNGHNAVVSKLLGAKAQVNLQGKNGATALIAAAAHGHALVVGQLLRAGADASMKARDGKTALVKARQNKFANVVGVLGGLDEAGKGEL